MSLLPDSASFHEQVETCFVAFRQKGVALSASDLELVDDWASTGAPFEVVARGIRMSAEQAIFHAIPGEFPLRSLRQCRRAVNAQVNRFLKLTVAGGEALNRASQTAVDPVPFHAQLYRSFKRDVKAHAKKNPDSFAKAVSWLTEPHSLDEALTLEERLLFRLLRALPFESRLKVLRHAKHSVDGMALTSAKARQQALRFHRLALAKQHFQFRLKK